MSIQDGYSEVWLRFGQNGRGMWRLKDNYINKLKKIVGSIT
jgi:hypothetical protein